METDVNCLAKWMLKRSSCDIEQLSRRIGCSRIILEILANRGFKTEEEIDKFINSTTDDLYSPSLFKDMAKGVLAVKESVRNGEKITVYGDYDVDGVMSSYILYSALSRCGANVSSYIPHRELEGYGMNNESIYRLKSEGTELIITCDNGIASVEQIDLARSLGMKVVVTDHHEVAYETDENGTRCVRLPDANAIINPKQPDCPYPFKLLCAGAIAYKFACALYKEFGIDESEALEFMEYAAIATICDVVDLVDENRIIAKRGLEMLRTTKNKGLNALIERAGLTKSNLGTYHVGFIIGPCINATGRLERATISLELLLCKDDEEAAVLAERLVTLNEERKQLTEKGVERVAEIIERMHGDDRVILAYDELLHESIAGIVAGRIKEAYNMPAIVLTNGKDMIKGSARSIEKYNMFEKLSECSELIEKFGGHPMAAGLSLKHENIEKLRRKLNELCGLTPDDIEPIIRIDKRLSLEEISFDLFESIKMLEPFGKGNPTPIFAEKNIRVVGVRLLGKSCNVLKLTCIRKGNGEKLEAVSFGGAKKFEELIRQRFGDSLYDDIISKGKCSFDMDFVYTIGLNEYMGRKSLQLILKDFR
ncbi:MAG: single-stranded-DNA-specific exonuclease RecJ [Peptoclostridium sp.]|nr:single-stranded-DNA-specific exonuclease RecJ [Peptoclostridium sp.]